MSRDALRVIGIGNELRGDDAAGLLAARELLRYEPGADVVVGTRDVATLAAALSGARSAVLVDAVAGGEPGAIVRYEAGGEPLPAGWRDASTHGLGVAAAIELARALGELPERVVVYGICGRRFGVGDQPSPTIELAAKRVAAAIRRELLADPGRPAAAV